MEQFHTHPLTLNGSAAASVFSLSHEHDRGADNHTHEVTPDGKTATSTTFEEPDPSEQAKFLASLDHVDLKPFTVPWLVGRVAAIMADDMFSIQVGPACSCDEAEVLADLLRGFGYANEAQTWLYGHSTGDEDGDDHFKMQEPA